MERDSSCNTFLINNSDLNSLDSIKDRNDENLLYPEVGIQCSKPEDELCQDKISVLPNVDSSVVIASEFTKDVENSVGPFTDVIKTLDGCGDDSATKTPTDSISTCGFIDIPKIQAEPIDFTFDSENKGWKARYKDSDGLQSQFFSIEKFGPELALKLGTNFMQMISNPNIKKEFGNQESVKLDDGIDDNESHTTVESAPKYTEVVTSRGRKCRQLDHKDDRIDKQKRVRPVDNFPDATEAICDSLPVQEHTETQTALTCCTDDIKKICHNAASNISGTKDTTILQFLNSRTSPSLPEGGAAMLTFGESSEDDSDGKQRIKPRQVNVQSEDNMWPPHFHPHNQEWRVRYRYKGSMRIKTVSCKQFGIDGAKAVAMAFVERWAKSGRPLAAKTKRSKLCVLDLGNSSDFSRTSTTANVSTPSRKKSCSDGAAWNTETPPKGFYSASISNYKIKDSKCKSSPLYNSTENALHRSRRIRLKRKFFEHAKGQTGSGLIYHSQSGRSKWSHESRSKPNSFGLQCTGSKHSPNHLDSRHAILNPLQASNVRNQYKCRVRDMPCEFVIHYMQIPMNVCETDMNSMSGIYCIDKFTDFQCMIANRYQSLVQHPPLQDGLGSLESFLLVDYVCWCDSSPCFCEQHPNALQKGIDELFAMEEGLISQILLSRRISFSTCLPTQEELAAMIKEA